MVTETTQVAQHAVESAGLLATLGIEPKLFIAQLVNFGLIVFVLWKWAYKPLLKAMDARATKIEQGLKDATAASQSRSLAEEDRANIVAEARKGAKEIMDAAAILAEKERAEATARAKAEVQKIVDQGREQIRTEKDKMMAEARTEVGTLVAMAAEKVLKAKIDVSKDASLIAGAIKDAERSA